MENGSPDPWIAPDKLYHVLFCLCLTIVFSLSAYRTRYPFLRRHSVGIGSVASLIAGAAKEAADQLGIFPSAGASAKDAVADLVGVLIAASVLSCRRTGKRPQLDSAQAGLVSMV
ncbi:hypothetical protein SAY87_014867 [Trapa incisa]|uniref:Uncharacterized protein n=1 Tax=Trapa incisa TaxID=236973 RepID=A0AAN7JDN2_9MYRT|nr:hypothetical protein SAY87_014867 [Trapa incisa]